MNIQATELGHIAESIQFGKYSSHVKALSKIKQSRSEYFAYSQPRHHEKVINKSKQISMTYNQKAWQKQLYDKNCKLLLSN